LISFGVCALAGAQASLPREKVRWWSRPLVAALFFLQPIVRGWARYQHRLNPRPVPEAARPTLDSLALLDGRQPLDEADFWTEERVDRVAFVSDILRQLDRRGWPNRADSGWDEYDVEIYDTSWSKIQLATVAEEEAHGQLVRCRLRARWSLKAKVAFWSLCGAELLVLGLIEHRPPALWLIVAAVPLLAWFLRREQRSLQSLIQVFLDEVAKGWKLTRVGAAKATEKPAAVPAAPAKAPAKEIRVRA
jgi:hypothetical protein